MRPTYLTVLSELRLLDQLREFHPVVIGTPPLGIDIETSDIDVACFANELSYFCDTVHARFCELLVSCELMEVRGELSACAKLRSHGWEIEVFCQTLAVEQQWGVRHFLVERRLLNLAPQLKPGIIQLKREGLKTEPAFAQVLKLGGDPYEAVLELEALEDEELANLAERSILTFPSGRIRY